MMSPKSGENVQAWAAAENSLRSCEYSSYHTVFCVSRCFWGSLSPGGIRSTRRFVTTKKKQQQRILLLSFKYPQALRSKTTTHSKKRKEKKKGKQEVSGRAGLFLVGVCSARMTNSHTHTHTSPGSPLSLSPEGRRQEAVGWDCTVEHW